MRGWIFVVPGSRFWLVRSRAIPRQVCPPFPLLSTIFSSTAQDMAIPLLPDSHQHPHAFNISKIRIVRYHRHRLIEADTTCIAFASRARHSSFLTSPTIPRPSGYYINSSTVCPKRSYHQRPCVCFGIMCRAPPASVNIESFSTRIRQEAKQNRWNQFQRGRHRAPKGTCNVAAS